jgi:toxin FitB
VNYLLDTNVLSELRKAKRAHPGVLVWFEQVKDDELFTSVLVLGELRRGVESLRLRDPVAALALEQWLMRLVDQFSERILPVDREVATRWGLLNVPTPIPTVNGLLAATALTHGLTLVTRNTRDVERTRVPVLNPFLR